MEENTNAVVSASPQALRTLSTVYSDTTRDYLSTVDPSNPPSLKTIEQELVQATANAFGVENAFRDKSNKFAIPKELTNTQIAEVLSYIYPIRRIACAGASVGAEYDVLAIYKESEGIYVTDKQVIRQLARQLKYNLAEKDFKEICIALEDMVERKFRCTDCDLVAMNNGIYNYSSKTLLPFSPDYIFLAKSKVDYNPSASNIIIHNDEDGTDWDVETWMETLSDDPEIVNVLWQILGAIIRPNVRWRKSAWFYSDTGNNGKGTLCELMRNLCGDTNYASIPLSEFSQKFALTPLLHASAIIVDENDVGAYIDRSANLKAIITNDVISIEEKYKSAIAYQFYGFMVQCLNEFPRIKDKSESFYRRQLFIKFDKCFTGKERRYIKDDYLHRKEVLEYVAYKVLHEMPEYYELTEPQACKDTLNDYKEFNDPVRQFFEEFSDTFTWNLLPFNFLYELYKAWFKLNSPSGAIQGRNTFIQDIIAVTQNDPNWYCVDKKQAVRAAGKMDTPEPLIAKYNLDAWKNPNYIGSDVAKMCVPMTQTSYRGLQRVNPIAVTPLNQTPLEEPEKGD